MEVLVFNCTKQTHKALYSRDKSNKTVLYTLKKAALPKRRLRFL